MKIECEALTLSDAVSPITDKETKTENHWAKTLFQIFNPDIDNISVPKSTESSCKKHPMERIQNNFCLVSNAQLNNES